MASKSSSPPTINVTFRLPVAEYELLEAQAAEKNTSAPLHARDLARAGLHQWGHVQELHSLAQDLQAIRSLLSAEREDLRRVAMALLVAHGMSKHDARIWAERNLGQAPEGWDS